MIKLQVILVLMLLVSLSIYIIQLQPFIVNPSGQLNRILAKEIELLTSVMFIPISLLYYQLTFTVTELDFHRIAKESERGNSKFKQAKKSFYTVRRPSLKQCADATEAVLHTRRPSLPSDPPKKVIFASDTPSESPLE
jgi:hypothetical protein